MKPLFRSKPYFPYKNSLANGFRDILQSGQFVQGELVEEFEERVANYVGTKYAIATNSCGTALEITLRCLPGGQHRYEWIVPTQTFVASVSCIIQSGYKPVIVDVDPITQCLTRDIIEQHYSHNITLGVILVNMAGLITPEIYDIIDFCKEKNIHLVTDDAHALGAQIYNETEDKTYKAGNLGVAGCFSFYPTKIITTGEGGMITTNDERIAKKALLMRNHGMYINVPETAGMDGGVTCEIPSSNYRMTEVAALMGNSQMKHIDRFIKKRNQIADWYEEEFKDVDEIKTPPRWETIRQTWWQYICQLDFGSMSRDTFCRYLLNRFRIPTANAYKPACHEQPAFSMYVEDAVYPNAEQLLNRHFSLPMYVELKRDDIHYIGNAIRETIEHFKKHPNHNYVPGID